MSVVTFRIDERTKRALDKLQEDTGKTRSEVLRRAILDAEEAALQARMREESRRLYNDPADRAEAKAVLEFMGGGSAW
jgi:predicted transcriptional regulator